MIEKPNIGDTVIDSHMNVGSSRHLIGEIIDFYEAGSINSISPEGGPWGAVIKPFNNPYREVRRHSRWLAYATEQLKIWKNY